MAYINHDVSTMAMPSGMNRMGQFPLDMSSVYYDKASLEAYAESGSIAYVGQIVSLVDEENNKVTVYSIQDKAGTLKEVGTVPTGDEKTIAVDANGKITLANIESLVFERDILGEDEQPTGEKENIQYQALLTKDGLVWVEPSKTTVEGLATLLDALTKRVDTLETKVGSAAVPESAEGAGDGKAATGLFSDIDALDARLDTLEAKEDKDTTYSVKAGEKILSLNGTEFSTTLKIVHENNYIKLLGINDEEISSFNASEFVADGVLEDVSYNDETKNLTFTWNIVTGEDESGNPIYKTDVVNIADLIDTYEAGKGLAQTGKTFEVVIDPASQDNLTVSETGLKLSGVKTLQEEINSPATNGTSVEFIDTISQNANGEITATKKKVNFPNLHYSESDGLVLGDSKIALQSDQLYFEYGKDETGSVNSSGEYLEISVSNIGETALSSDLQNVINETSATATDAQNRVGIVEGKIDEITSVGGEPNVIERIKVNGTTLEVEKDAEGKSLKSVNITVPTKFTDLNDDSGFDTRITAAQTKANEAASAANANATTIQTLGTNLDTANGKITALETAKEDHATRITNLETKTSGHDTTIASHTQSITELTSGIATKAEQTALNEAVARIAANESAITTLNDTTIVNINTEIAKKADISALENYYTKTQIGTIEDGKTLVEMIADAQTAATYDDTAIKALIQGNTDAITNITKEDGLIATAKAEALKAIDDLAKGAVKDNTDAIAKLNGEAGAEGSVATIADARIAAALAGADEDFDTLKEMSDWLSTHADTAATMNSAITDNANAIKAINDTTIPNAIATANSYTDTTIAALKLAETYEAKGTAEALLGSYKVKTVDDITLQVNSDGEASVKAISTDLLVQGSEELIFKAGDAGTKTAE